MRHLHLIYYMLEEMVDAAKPDIATLAQAVFGRHETGVIPKRMTACNA